MRIRLALSLLLLALLPLSAGADELSPTHAVTVDDYFTLAGPTEVALSPDGENVAYAEARWDKDAGDRKADLWVVSVKTGKARRLTAERFGVNTLRWSPDARSIFFAGKQSREGAKNPPFNGKTQVWRVSLSGGPAEAVTRLPDGIDTFDLSGDGRSLWYVTSEERKAGAWKDLRDKFKDVEYGQPDETKISLLHRLDLESWRVEKVNKGRVIRELAVAPDGRRVAMITTPDGTVATFEGQSRVEVYDTRTHKTIIVPDRLFRAEAPSPYGWLERPAWSGDSEAVAFNVIFDGYPAEILVADLADSEPKMTRLKRPGNVMVRGYGSPVAWSGKSDLLFLGEEKARVRLCCAAGIRSGKEEIQVWTPGEVVVSGLSAGFGRTAVILGTPTQFHEVALADPDGKPRVLTDLNPQTRTWKMPSVSVATWKGARGDTVEGVLELPPDHKPGTPLPLVVAIHGGPTAAVYCERSFDLWEDRMLLAARGYALLCPNYRGSSGYGDRFLTDLVGHENDIEVEDILKGVDALVEKKIADPDRLAVMGWSNGGYLTNCVLTKTTRFKAASSGAGIVDTVMEWGANDEPAYMAVLKQGLPWSNPDAYRKTSPTYQLNKIRTPTLIHVGGSDERCPPSHSRMLYRALKLYNKVPTELLIYPGEPHGPMKYQNRKAKMEWDIAWFERYVLGKKEK
jgi:dipeptidyl aminopeptidase/acylaminoacyl peptidase